MTDRFLFLLGGARREGNTERLARRAAAALGPGTETRWLRHAELPLEPFEDVRHREDRAYAAPQGNAATLVEATLWASDVVVAAPTYWYALPAASKLYLTTGRGGSVRPASTSRRAWPRSACGSSR